jgi:hypothetical protein
VDELLLELARVQRPSGRLRTLLTPHKIALLAIERQSAGLAREHVVSARNHPERVAGAARHLRSAHIVSSQLARRHLKSELQVLGLKAPEDLPQPGSSYIQRLNYDLRPALRAAPSVLTDEEKAHRAALAAVAAANRAYTDTQLLGYQAAMEANPGYEIRKQWVTNERAGSPPCSLCRELNGRIVALSDEFPLVGNTLPYVDLLGPPRHPWCRCRIIPRLYRLDLPFLVAPDATWSDPVEAEV